MLHAPRETRRCPTRRWTAVPYHKSKGGSNPRFILTISTYLIEDNPLIRESISAALQELTSVRVIGYAETEADALLRLRQSSDWHLAIVDVFLKQGNGLNVVAALSKRQPNQKLIVLSNYATPEIRKRCEELGVDAVFDKSTDIERLIDYCMNLEVA
jgi:two-component system, OmpR family, response regulator